MRLNRVRVENYRSIEDATMRIGEQTALLGSNGAGKSNFIKAINRFYASDTKMREEDFFDRNFEDPIRITLTFGDLTAEEREKFGSRIHQNELTVTREFSLGGGNQNGRFFGQTRQHPRFAEIRQIDGARNRRSAYDELRQEDGYDDLPAVTNAAQLDAALDEWEAQNPNQLELAQDDGQFLGFANVARGSLTKHTTAVFIPAVRDAAADAIDGKSSVIANLMDLLVKTKIQSGEEFRRFQQRTAEEYGNLISPENLQELGDLSNDLTRTLETYYGDTSVELTWQPADNFSVPLPNADVAIDDDGFTGPVEGKGHGLQRAFVLTILQHLAAAIAEADHEREFAAADEAMPAEEEPENDLPPYVPPHIILLIEEPEIYQHPTKQRHFARILSELANGTIEGVTPSTQVVFASHSPHFISMERFDDIRIARKIPSENADCKQCTICDGSLSDVASALNAALDLPDGHITAQTLRPRLHTIGTEICEGFFAEFVVLVEGTSDKAAIEATAELLDVSLEAEGIAVLPVEGKTSLAKTILAFREFDIPTFHLFDCDQKANGIEHLDHNHALQRVSVAPPAPLFDAQTYVGADFACFENKIEATLRQELTEQILDTCCETVKNAHDVTEHSAAMKSPRLMYEILRLAADQGHRSATLEAMVGAILAARRA